MDLRELEDAILALDYTGKQVACEVCFRVKDPRGRSMPMDYSGCNSDCRGYTSNPYPGPLHYGERASEYGYAGLPFEQCLSLWRIIQGIRERREEAEGE